MRTSAGTVAMRSLFTSIVAASAVSMIFASPVRANCPTERVGQFGGASKVVAVNGDRAYVGMGARLIVLDISGSGDPVVLGSIMTNGTVTDIALSGALALVGSEWWSMEIIDVTNPQQPIRVGEYSTVFPTHRILVRDQIAFVLSDNIGLHVVDFSNPANPVRIGQYNMCCPGNAELIGDLMYVRSSGWILLDISDPTSPTFVAHVPELNAVKRMSIVQDRLYAAMEFGARFRVFDISTPAEPVLLGYKTLSSATEVDVVGNVAYVTANEGLLALDISNLSDIQVVGQSNAPTHLTSIALAGNRAVVGSRNGAVGLVSLTSPASPQLLGDYRECGPAWRVKVSNDHAFVSSQSYGPALHSLGLAHPAEPTLTGVSADEISNGNDFVIRGNLAYMASSYDGMRIYDISNPAAPLQLVNPTVSFGGLAIAVEGSVAYLAAGGSLQAVDVSDPVHPTAISALFHSRLEDAEHVAVSGNAIYVSAPSTGSSVVNVATPSAMALVGAFPGSFYAYDIAVSGQVAYVADAELGLAIYNVSNPLSPTLLFNSVNLFGMPIVVKNDAAYVGARIIDVSKPAAPSQIGTLPTFTYLSDFDVVGSYVYAASGDAGVSVFRTCIPADVNCDNAINGLDVGAFSKALIDPAGFQSAHPYCNYLNADADRNGVVDSADILPFIQRVLE